MGPAAGEDGGADPLVGREEGEDLVEDWVRERAQAVAGCSGFDLLSSLHWGRRERERERERESPFLKRSNLCIAGEIGGK